MTLLTGLGGAELPQYSLGTTKLEIPGTDGKPPIVFSVLKEDECTAVMIEDLTKQVSAAQDGLSAAATEEARVTAHNALKVLIDIALFRDDDSLDARHIASHAEKNLLWLYGSPATSAQTREDMVTRLIKAHTIFADSDAPAGSNRDNFGMPAALLHMVAQHVDKEVRETNSIYDQRLLEEMELGLLASVGFRADEERSIANPQRFITDTEMDASFSALACGYPDVVNLSESIPDKDVSDIVNCVLSVVDEVGMMAAPIYINQHFLLLVAEKDEASAQSQYKLTVVNSNLSVDKLVEQEMDRLSYEQAATPSDSHLAEIKHAAGMIKDAYEENIRTKLMNGVEGTISSIEFISDSLQGNVPNACGALVALMAQWIDRQREAPGFDTKAALQEGFDLWHGLSAQQQQAFITAQRAEMIGLVAEQEQATRYIRY